MRRRTWRQLGWVLAVVIVAGWAGSVHARVQEGTSLIYLENRSSVKMLVLFVDNRETDCRAASGFSGCSTRQKIGEHELVAIDAKDGKAVFDGGKIQLEAGHPFTWTVRDKKTP